MSEVNQLLQQSQLAEQFTYEVSLWTLQDKFLTVLKWANIDVKGQIQEPNVTISDDGTREFTFSIPKFYYLGKDKMFNPLWQKVQDSPIEANMHKLKLIFNKMTEDEAVEEFLVTSVVETHSQDNIMIEVSAEGLAFHELGKIGYKISLTSEDFDEESYQWFIQGMEGDEPINNIQYWNDKVFKDAEDNWRLDWTYEVRMDWSAYSQASEKDPEVIYEDEYVASWELNNDDRFMPREIEDYREKYRYVEAEESNIYNITQDIAKVFGVFCKYEYEHDAQYYITGKKVVYYNNYLQEVNTNGNVVTTHLDLTYPYSSSSVKRTIDSTDIVTKMFVRTVDDNAEDTNIISIMNVEANKSKEDYLLNFDYLHEIGTISDEQYAAIEDYEVAMHKINSQLISIENQIMIYLNELTEMSAKATYYNNALQLDLEQYDDAQARRAALTGGSNYIPITDISPRRFVVHTEKNDGEIVQHYIKLDIKGLDPNTISLYTNFDTSKPSGERLTGQLTTYQCEFDDFDNLIGINHIQFPVDSSGEEQVASSIRLTGMYSPQLYYDNIARVWAARQGQDQMAYDAAFENENKLAWYLYGARAGYARVDAAHVGGERIDTIARIEKTFINLCRTVMDDKIVYNEDKDEYTTIFDDKSVYTPDLIYTQEIILQEKQQIINAFERMMGPALREGYWQPEDYNDYGDKYLDTFTISSNRVTPQYSNLVSFSWDGDKRYDGEAGVLFQSSVDGTMEQYPIIDISNILDKLILYNLNELSFIYYDKVAIDTITEILSKITDLTNNPTDSSPTEINILQERIEELKHSNLIRSFTLGSQCEFGFIREANTEYTPVIIITDSTLLTAAQIAQFTSDSTPSQYKPFIGIRELNVADDNKSVEEHITTVATNLTFIGRAGEPLSNVTNETYEITRVYPRIYINSLKLKNNSDELLINLNDNYLTEFEDYYVLVDERGDTEDTHTAGYYITLKPNSIIQQGNKELKIDISFELSNAGVAIYLDAMKIMKENAYPKVSYDIELCALDYNLLRTAYQKLNYIVHINDLDLQLQDVCGYISSISIPLDKVWETTAEIKNYETKFEDLFSTIVAETEAMQKNEFAIGNLANAFTTSGMINNDVLQQSIMRADLNYSFNQGTLTIDQTNGIWGTSPDGVVAFRGGGIFTATSKDDNGNWKWNTGILPSGINANLITSGQLDTDKIRIFAGDQIQFQLNAEGLFAYKSFIGDTLDASEYVVFNSNGVFLKNTITYTNDDEEDITTDSSRVEISWDGLIIRNNRDEKVFYADNDGNLRLTGIITAKGGSIGGWEIQEGRLHNTYIDLISNDEDGKIELTDATQQIIYTINDNGITYNLYKNRIDDGISYYISQDDPNALLNEIINPPAYYLYQLQNVAVSPKYTWAQESTNLDAPQNGTDIDQEIQTQDATVTTTVYIVGAEGATVPLQDSNGNPIVYNGGNSLDSEWYIKLLSNDSYTGYIDNYVDYVKENQLINVQNTDTSLVLLQQQYRPNFSVSAKTGTVIIPRGSIGGFNLTSNELSSNYNMSISSTNLSGDNYVDGNSAYALSKYKNCFCNFESDSENGTFTLTTVGGGRVTFNIASTSFYATKLAEAGKLKNAKTEKNSNKITFSIESGYGNKYKTTYNASGIYSAGYNLGYQEGQASNAITLSSYSATISRNGSHTASAKSGHAWNRINITVSVQGGGSSSGSGACFIAGTMIKLYDQTEVPIEQLQMGMQVLAYDEENETFHPSEILTVQKFHNAINIYDVYLSSGKKLTLTSSHPILAVDGWKAIDAELALQEHEIYIEDLHIGDVVIAENENVSVVDIIPRKDLDNSTVYNINVEPIDTYIANSIVVHNANQK